MTAHIALKLQQSPLGAVLPECWKLVPERAVTLHPDGAGILRISGGRVWATVDGPHHGPANDWGDVVLRSGEQLQLLPGQQVVVEAYGEAVNEPAYFSWEPAPTVPAQHGFVPSPWGDALARPMLRFDLALPTLLAGVARGLAWLGNLLHWLVQGRGRVLSPMEFNQP
ncbi:MAG: DUF2917 domain-containing protein [Rhodoferax sp.]|nr:DUF2917 domain-containing protein [Rhodoferax sp.]